MSCQLQMSRTLEHFTDEELLPLMATGDLVAFEMIYERRQPSVYRFALRMSGSETLAEDVTQDVFIALMRDAYQFDPTRGSLSTYLYGITRNRVLKRLERDKNFVAMPDDDEADSGSIDERMICRQDPLADFTRNQVIDAVRQAVLALPTHYREVIILCNLHEMNYEEAASIIGCAVGTVRSRLSRARELLMKKLQTTADIETTTSSSIPARYVL
ncbi:MAG: sigma-70 family RNA polymerase sigma factor [Acidobacteriota bacterium]